MTNETNFKKITSWVIVIWIALVFLPSIPFKFMGAPETQHIFGTIGKWLSGFLGGAIGGAFSRFGAYVIGSMELLTSLILLAPGIVFLLNKIRKKDPIAPLNRQKFHAIGGLGATALMGGAIFFHLFSRLGIDVNDDGGALFYSAVSVFILGIVLFLLNRETSPCEDKSLFGRLKHRLKPRSWKHWLFWVELGPLVVLGGLACFLSFYVHQAYTDRYPDQVVASVPEF